MPGAGEYTNDPTLYAIRGDVNNKYITGRKESLESTWAKEDLMENVQRDELSGLKFYLDENWWVVYLPEAAPSPSSSRNQAEHHPTNSPITMASQHHLQPSLRQTQEVHFMWKSLVEPEQPGQSAMLFLHNQPPEQPIEVHAPSMPQGSDQVNFRPRDLSWKYAHRVPNGKSCRVQCNLCGKVICNISRMKEHLAYTGKTLSCPRATDQIRQEIASYIIAKKNSRACRASLSAGHGAA